MKLLLWYIVVAVFLYEGGLCKRCKTRKIKVTSSRTLSSPSYPKLKPFHRCFPYRYTYTGPVGTQLSVSCESFHVQCSKKNMLYYFKAEGKERCGTSFPTVQSSSNKMSIEFKSGNKKSKKNKTPFRFRCTIKVVKDLTCDCGKRMSKFRSRIVGGVDAEEGEFPYQVSLQYSNREHKCGGSLISDQWFVTAHHCEVQPNDDVAVLGEHKLNETSGNELVCDIMLVVVHPDYDNMTYLYDVAVVKLKNPVSFTDYIQPICLPDHIPDNSFVGRRLTASGWGDTIENINKTSNVLQAVELDVISNDECKTKGGYYATDIFPWNICTLTIDKDACQGDSGGPLADVSGFKTYLIGVTSWGIGCARHTSPGVWTDVLNPGILEWIKSNAGLKCTAPTN